MAQMWKWGRESGIRAGLVLLAGLFAVPSGSGLARPLLTPADPAALETSVHAGLDCATCHVDTAAVLPGKSMPAPDCAVCHDGQALDFSGGIHGRALAKGDPDAPACADCHGTHDIRAASDSLSATSPANTAVTCARCHADPQLVRRHDVPMADPLAGYEQSVHWKAILEGKNGATCTSCHRAHDIRPMGEPTSSIHREHVPETCGTCHGGVLEAYRESVHGKAVLEGNADAPVCTDCHGEHEIRGPEDPRSLVYPREIAQTTCPSCHESERIARKYGLAAKRLTSYLDSYHGLASKAGGTTIANCASCHGIHDILPSSDPRSSIHADNLGKTCGKCHIGANEKFAVGRIHEGMSEPQTAAGWVRSVYLWLIAVVIGGMLLHNGMDLLRRLRENLEAWRREQSIERLTRVERLQHGAMAASFILLAYTGFALRFPEAWWAYPVVAFEERFSFRGWIHRIAGVLMIATSLWHLVFLLFTRRGHYELREMRIRLEDAREALAAVRHNLGWGPAPATGRFGYVEKLEYWALVWGTFVMSATGLLLWFNTWTMRTFSRIATEVATAIHYYEAWLAVLAIVIWHFYAVLFRPDAYPMNWTWLTGRISRSRFLHEHPLEAPPGAGGGPRPSGKR